MARIQFGSIITDSRGRIGGHQIKGTRFGPTLMPAAAPTNRQTQRQQDARAIVGALAQAWTTELTAGERSAWIALGATQDALDTWGNTYPLTGNDLWLRLNVKRLAAGLPILTTAPADQVVTSPISATAGISAGPTLTISYTTAPAPANHRVRIYSAPPQSPGTSTAQGRYSLLTITAASPLSPIDLTTAYTSRFGAINAGRKIFAQMSFWNSTNSAESQRITTSVNT